MDSVCGPIEVKFSANDLVRTLGTAHLCRLILSAKVETLRSSLHELEGLQKE